MTPCAVYTAEEFAEKMEDFIGYCEIEKVDATDYQLINFFNISLETLDKYMSEDIMNNDSIHKTEAYATAFRKLGLYREDATIRQIVTDSKLTRHGAFKLKQPRWGSWDDKQEPSQQIKIVLKIGDGGKELLD